ncbi:RsmD family RNA methyltransferase [Radiobacillus kanasensis]|uniref:TRM11 family SAM-dependent methyltransferase n=1 Tax=Radiobacillus kanasensis TaxID=2844358 RepID=UPI001E633C41|nr:RsmD family RNA methyltransferase [Radiobacillus kanasensis]UFU00754.1 RsmD family RNA methyltransferase [Radiobacillus kanasensis]
MSYTHEPTYIYNYTCAEEEISLCALEMRTLFQTDTHSQYTTVESNIKMDPSRSPFIRERIDILYEGESISDIIPHLREMDKILETFKVRCVQNKLTKIELKERRRIEREVGLHIPGTPDLHNPERVFGVMFVNGSWVFGDYHENRAVWLQHKNKPNSYSTALNTRVARAIVNIAIPNPEGVRAIDPCCGIGTVLIEALSMGIDIEGSDNNPLVMKGVRENIGHFHYSADVALRDIKDITNRYDIAIIDLPYNLCSVLSDEEKLEMLQSARQFTKRLVVVTVEPIDDLLRDSGFHMLDRAELRKRKFVRQIIVCE